MSETAPSTEEVALVGSDSTPEHLQEVVASLRAGEDARVLEIYAHLHAADIAKILEALQPQLRAKAWALVPPDLDGEVLGQVREGVRSALLGQMDTAELVAAAETLDVPQLVEVIDELPAAVSEAVLESLDDVIRDRVETTRTFEEGTAGRLMHGDVITVRSDVRIEVVLRYLRRHRELPPHTDALMVVDRDGRLLGVLSMATVVTSEEQALVNEMMIVDFERVYVHTPERQAAALFERRELNSLPVVDANEVLMGRLVIDDLVDIVRQEAERAFMRRAGLQPDEDLFAPVLPSAKRRAVWLGINLATAFLAAWVIDQFEAALDKLVALAVLMPIVASMGGIAGSQTLTLVIRGMALGQVARSNVRWLTAKELAIGVLNGIGWAVVVGVCAVLWFHDTGLGLVIGAAIVINLLAAALSGVIVPLMLRRVGVDPALSGAVVLTTVTDVVGFMSFLGLATIFLL